MHIHIKWREALLEKLRNGEISIVEASLIAGVRRQAVWQWCVVRGIDPAAARAKWLLGVRAVMQRKIAKASSGDVAVQRARSKSRLRAQADKAKASWDQRNGRDSAD